MNELPSWSGRALESEPEPSEQQNGSPQSALEAEPQQHVAQGVPVGVVYQEPRRRGLITGLLLGLLAGLLLAAVGVGAYWLGRQDADEVAAVDPAPAEAEADELASEATDAETTDPDDDSTLAVGSDDDDDGSTDAAADADGDADAGADDAATTLPEDGVMAAPDGYESTDPNYETRIQNAPAYAVVRGGMVYLYGFSATQEDLEESIAVTEAVMGPDGYVVERFVDPDRPETEGAPIYVDDKVLFGFNSTELVPEVLPILDLGVLLMLQNPTANMRIIARSDAVGRADSNLEISQRRGDAVVEYWVSQGVERSRMTVEARGEADASDDDTPEVAALNRSVEFVVSDIDED